MLRNKNLSWWLTPHPEDFPLRQSHPGGGGFYCKSAEGAARWDPAGLVTEVKRWPLLEGSKDFSSARHASHQSTLHWPEQVGQWGGLSLPLERVPELLEWPTFTCAWDQAPTGLPLPAFRPHTPVPAQATAEAPAALPPTVSPQLTLCSPLWPLWSLFRPQGLCTGPPHPVTVFSQLVLGTCPSVHPDSGSTCCGGGERELPHMASLRRSGPGPRLSSAHSSTPPRSSLMRF